MSDSLMSIFKKERPWGNRSRRSLIWATMRKSVLLLLYKRATMSKSISSLCKKERHEWFTHGSRESLSKTKNIFSFVFDSFSLLFPFFVPTSELLPSHFAKSLFFKEWLGRALALAGEKERIAPVALYKRATVSNSLP